MPNSAAPDGSQAELLVLKSTVITTLDLIEKLSATIQPAISSTRTTPTQNDLQSNLHALRLAQDASSLIRAHATKLSLLIINKPFTPSAITTVLRELVAGPLPGLASSLELCDTSRYTKTVKNELAWKIRYIYKEFIILVRAIPVDGKILSDDAKNGTGKTTGKGSLASTAVVWKVCDEAIELNKLGVTGILIKLVNSYKDLIEDALLEVQDWDEEEREEENLVDSGDENDGLPRQHLDDFGFPREPHIPVESEDVEKIRPRFESCVKRMKLVILMYKAIMKRRLKTLPALPAPSSTDLSTEIDSEPSNLVQTVDSLMDALKEIPNTVDELANAFYNLDSKLIDLRTEQCFSMSISAAELLVKNWKGQEDEYTIWVKNLRRHLIPPATKSDS